MAESNSAIRVSTAVAAGLGLWFIGAEISGRREAWDSGIYWAVFYPISIVACGVLGYLFPERAWRWAPAFFLGQCVAMLLRNGELGNLFPLGLILFGILSLPGVVVAKLGARLKGCAPEA
jgi:hypothetical protein